MNAVDTSVEHRELQTLYFEYLPPDRQQNPTGTARMTVHQMRRVSRAEQVVRHSEGEVAGRECLQSVAASRRQRHELLESGGQRE